MAGALVQVSQAFYFQALEYSEAGIVAAYWNMVPVILPVTSYFLLGQSLSIPHYIGIAILVVVSAAFCLLESRFNGQIRSFYLMIIACLLQTAFFLVNKALFDHCPFFIGFLLVTLGIIISGSIPLLFPKIRKTFAGNMATLKPAIPMLVGIEVINLVAYFFSQRAISLGAPSLVAAVESSIPAYTFVISAALFALIPRLGDPRAKERLWLKLLLVGAMAIGVGLVSDRFV